MSRNEILKSMGVEVWKLRSNESLSDSKTVERDVNVVTQSGTSSAQDVTQMNILSLAEAVESCDKCELYKTRTNTVFGSGSHSADLMFIGEGPGEAEDRQGLPFVGKAGTLLTSMISALGYSRDEVFISNVVKCRPPRNRDPRPQEANTCAQYLKRQIELISPKVIVALGRVSAQLLLDTELSLAELRRETHKYYDTGVDLVVTYHPAYLLRRPTEKAKSWEDLWRVRLLLTQN